MSARLLTDGYSVWVFASKNRSTGRTSGAFLMNRGSGETPSLEVAIRRGDADGWMLLVPKEEPRQADVVGRRADEVVVRIPPLPALGIAAIVAESSLTKERN